MEPYLHLESVSKRFGGVQAVDRVSLSIQPGEVHCLAGENGSGKSTLIKLIAGIHRPDSGTIAIEGERLHHIDPIESIRRGIQVIYQDLSLFPNLTVAENLVLNDLVEHRRRFISWRAIRRTARRALDMLGVSLNLRRTVDGLSVAEKQLVAVARALLQDASLIVMDEPTAALATAEANALFDVISGLKQRGVAVLFVSHKLREMRRISDRFTFLRDGKVVAEGPAAQFDEGSILLHMTGRSLQEAPRTTEVTTSPREILEVERLSGEVLQEVSFKLHSGEIVGLTGLLGSGQSELALTLFGALSARSGKIRIRGVSTRIRRIQDAVAAGIAYVPEDRLSEGLFLEQSVERNAVAAGLSRLSNRWGLLSPRRLREQATSWLSRLSVKTESPGQPAKALSGGNQQRVVLARWLSLDPDILILNGPTVGIDVRSKEEIHGRLRGLAARGMGILLISDDLLEIAGCCDRVLILHRGRLDREFDGGDCNESLLANHLSALT